MPCARCGVWLQRPRWIRLENPTPEKLAELEHWRYGQDGEEIWYSVCEPSLLLQDWLQLHNNLIASLPCTSNNLRRKLAELRASARRVQDALDCESADRIARALAVAEEEEEVLDC